MSVVASRREQMNIWLVPQSKEEGHSRSGARKRDVSPKDDTAKDMSAASGEPWTRINTGGSHIDTLAGTTGQAQHARVSSCPGAAGVGDGARQTICDLKAGGGSGEDVSAAALEGTDCHRRQICQTGPMRA